MLRSLLFFICSFLLSIQVLAEVSEGELDIYDQEKVEKLFPLIEDGFSRRVKRLVQGGFSPNLTKRPPPRSKEGYEAKIGPSALYVAVDSGFSHSVKVLLEAGADPNAGFNAEYLPLNACLEAHNSAFAKKTLNLLLEAGADPHFKNNEGLSSLDFAWKLGKFELYAQIRKKGFDDPERDFRKIETYKKRILELEKKLKRKEKELIEVKKLHWKEFFTNKEELL